MFSKEERKLMIKIILTTIAALFLSFSVSAACYVNGYYKSNGTYVSGYYKTCPNYTKKDNYSTWGNSNPYTKKKGYSNKSCGLYSLNC